jgi:hypothetical protein
MSGQQFIRNDVHLSVRQTRTGGAEIDLGGGPRIRLTTASLHGWQSDGEPPTPLRPNGRLSRALAARTEPSIFTEDRVTVSRIVLDLQGPAVISLPWEAALTAAVPGPIMRSSRIRPRCLDAPLTFPLRMLQLSSDTPPTHLLDLTIGAIMPANSGDAVVVERIDVADLSELLRRRAWPAVEVLEVAGSLLQPASTSPAGAPAGLLSTGRPDRIGTLGWIERLSSSHQTRLLVIDCGTAEEAEEARLLAAELVVRGGPAVVVADRAALESFSWFYANVIHDVPLEMAARNAGPALSLTAGRHGEEALRISRAVDEIGDLANRLADPDPTAHADVLELRQAFERADRLPDFTTLATVLPQFPYASLRYDREGAGLVPLARHLARVRLVSRVGRADSEGSVLDPAPERIATASAPDLEERYLNVGLYADEEPPHLIPLVGDALVLDRPCLLGVEIGPEDAELTPTGALPLLEEIFAWEPEAEGVWAEVAVIGIDFDVAGAEVQQLWVPRRGLGQRVFFTVVPRSAPAATLRVCVYVKTNLVQSVRLAAVVRESPGDRPPDSGVLAGLLDLSPDSLESVSWRSRLEYATRGLGTAAEHHDRALSLVVNNLGGRSVVAAKGDDLLIAKVYTDASLPELVTKVRDALELLSTPPAKPDMLESDRPYGYGLVDDPNGGTPEGLKAGLAILAERGWDLFNAVVRCSAEEKARIREALDTDPRPIHVAHIYLDHVIPWAVAYDRRYIPPERLSRSKKQAVTHGNCPASLPDADGRMSIGRCGEAPECLLHGTEETRREAAKRTGKPLYLDESVVCARRFWGFGHQIELPVQQVSQPGVKVPEAAHELYAEPRLRMVVGMNSGLPQAGDHLEALRKKVTAAERGADIVAEVYDRDDVRDELEPVDLDIVYLYCHADGGTGTGIDTPILRFRTAGDDEDRSLQAADLDANAWRHRPLIVLNGCRTANFRPDALSPFLRKFLQDRRAGALLGTEISVWEQLATEVGAKFLDAFLNGHTVGGALLLIRRDLLARANPLGLAYTLYADADFGLAPTAVPRPVHRVGAEIPGKGLVAAG